jgi:hypothetical protein
MKIAINTLVASLIDKADVKKGSVGAIIGIKEDDSTKKEQYLVEMFNVPGHPHDQIYYKEEEIYAIQQ